MKRDFKTTIVLLAFSLPVIAVLFIGSIYLYNCGINNNCAQGDLAAVIHTPMPTLLPATLPAASQSGSVTLVPALCSAPARTLLDAWVSAGSSQDQPFNYVDSTGNSCTATFSDIQPLFTRSDLWVPGALACATCHNAALAASAVGLDLSSYSGILAGSNGTDILGGGNWDNAILNQVLFVQKQMPVGAPAGSLTNAGPLLQAGQVAASSITPTPQGVEEVPEPSNPGPAGQAVNLTGDPTSGAALFKSNCATCHGNEGTGGVPNPGSNDETVPPLNPIDPLLKDPDPKVFAFNIDLFIQHGSTPEGTSPFRNMPGWGDKNAITQQQIADMIAYIISLNK
jgi:mono/diheme cytochrome c family protein